MVRITPFGGCGVHNPLAQFYTRRQQSGLLPKPHYQPTPFSLSANTNHQLIDFATGNLEIPAWIHTLAYGKSPPPTVELERHILSGDIALVEMSTPTEFIFEDVLLNINRFEEIIIPHLEEHGSERKFISKWKGALRRANEEIRALMSGKIYELLPQDTPERRDVARFVRDTTSRMLGVDEMTESIGDLRDRLAIPVALILHNAHYMPDGRPVPWPADFKDNCIEVARRLGIPTLDFAAYVANEGADKVLRDGRHWSPDYFEPLGEMMDAFCEGVLDGRISAGPTAPMGRSPQGDAADRTPTPTPPAPAISVREASAAPEIAEPRAYAFDCNSGGLLPADQSTIFAVVVLGGVWANGGNSDLQDQSVSAAPEHPGTALMFDCGVRPRGRDSRGFVDLRERGSGSAKETPCAGIADQVMRNCETRFGMKPTMLFFSVSRGGTSLSGRGMTPDDGLLRGSAQHREVMRLIAQARDIAANRRKRLEVAAICLLHGEYEVSQNIPGSSYRRGLSILQQQYDADIRAVTRQFEAVRLYVTQTNRLSLRSEPEIPMAQLGAKSENRYVQCVGPTYFATPEVREVGPSAYVTASGYRRIGQVFGRYLLDDLWGAQRGPLRVESAHWAGPKTVRLRFTGPVGLEEDDARVNITELGPGRGIEFSDGTPWSPTVMSVAPVRARESELDVELTAPSMGYSKRLLIAGRPTGRGGVGCLEGPRSGIRSKEPFDTDPLDGTALFDWACTETLVLP